MQINSEDQDHQSETFIKTMSLNVFFMTAIVGSPGSFLINLRGNVGENQTDPPTCRHNLCSYSGYQKYS